jgi:tetratricopeptide (TPR) repeat protein
LKKVELQIIASSLDNIGHVYIKLHDFLSSFYYFQMAYKLVFSIDEKWRKTKILNHMGQYHLHQSNFNLSLEYLRKSFNNSRHIKAQDLVLENLITFSEYYAKTNDYKQAYEYILRYSQLSDSIITSGSHIIAAMQLRYEMGKQEKEKQI